MKKLSFYLFAIVSLALVGCTEGQLEPSFLNDGGTVLKATIESQDTKAKITDSGSVGDPATFAWATGDAIGVYNGSTFTTMTLSAGADTKYGTFSTGESFTPQAVAVFPNTSAVSTDGTTVLVNYPATYSSYTSGSFNTIMVAAVGSDPNAVSFKHTGAIIKLVLNSVPVGATSLEFTAKEKNITGDFPCPIANPVAATSDGSNSTVTFSFTARTSENNNMVFYIPVPAGNYGQIGYVIKAESTTKAEYWTYGSVGTIAQNTLVRLPGINYVGDAALIQATADATIKLPRISTPVNVIIPASTEVTVQYQDDAVAGEKPASVIIETTGIVGTLHINLPNSSVTLNGSSCTNVDTYTDVHTLNVNNQITNLFVKQGGVTIGPEGSVTGLLKVESDAGGTGENAITVDIQGTVGTLINGDANSTTKVTGTVATFVYDDDTPAANINVSGETVGAQVPVDDVTNSNPDNLAVAVSSEDELVAALAATAIKTISLSESITLTSSLETSRDVVLDLNEKTLANANDPAIHVASGHLTTQNGTVEQTGDDKDIIDVSGTLTVKSGTYKALSGWGICGKSNSVITIEKGTFATKEMTVLAWHDNVNITIEDGTFSSTDNAIVADHGTNGRKNNTITINGGTFNGSVTSEGYLACGVYCANDDVFNINGGTFNITNGPGVLARAGQVNIGKDVKITTSGTAVGKVGDSRVVVPCSAIVFDEYGSGYPGLTDAAKITVNSSAKLVTSEGVDDAVVIGNSSGIERISGIAYASNVSTEASLKGAIASSAATINVTADIVMTGTDRENAIWVKNGRTVSLKMNNYAIKRSQHVFVVDNGSLTVTGPGSIGETQKDGYSAIMVYGSENSSANNYSVVTLDNVTLEGWSGIFINHRNQTSAYGIKVSANNVTFKGLTDEALSSPENCVYINGFVKQATGNVPQITLTGCVAERGIYAAGYAQWTLTNNIIQDRIGWSAIELRAGQMTIKSGEYSSSASFFSAVSNNNGNTMKGAAVAVSQHNTNLPIDVTISGGTFTAAHSLHQENLISTTSATISLSVTEGIFNGEVYSSKCTGFLSGGSYNSEPGVTYIKTGYGAVESSGTWTIKPQN